MIKLFFFFFCISGLSRTIGVCHKTIINVPTERKNHTQVNREYLRVAVIFMNLRGKKYVKDRKPNINEKCAFLYLLHLKKIKLVF